MGRVPLVHEERVYATPTFSRPTVGARHHDKHFVLGEWTCSPPSVDRIWGIWGSYYDMPRAIFYLLEGDLPPGT